MYKKKVGRRYYKKSLGMNTVRVSGIERARGEVNRRQTFLPNMIHSARYKNGAFYVSSSDINDYIDDQTRGLLRSSRRARFHELRTRGKETPR